MAIIWPGNLQQHPLVNGFSATESDNKIRFESETGPGKTSPLQSNAVGQMNVSVVVTREQRNDLWYFYRTVTAYGCLRFYWPGADEAYDDQWHTYEMTKPNFTPFGCDFQARMELTGWPAVSYFQALLFAADERGGLYLPDDPRFTDAAATNPADTVGDRVRVWTSGAGPDNAVAPSDTQSPTLV